MDFARFVTPHHRGRTILCPALGGPDRSLSSTTASTYARLSMPSGAYRWAIPHRVPPDSTTTARGAPGLDAGAVPPASRVATTTATTTSDAPARRRRASIAALRARFRARSTGNRYTSAPYGTNSSWRAATFGFLSPEATSPRTLAARCDTFRALDERVFPMLVEHAFALNPQVRTYVLDSGREVL